ncbi:glycosyltransferase [Rhodococcus sp. NPDC059234]|uniref:glycosyltransferase n=1 Tax=Rhodococcus sp. NPDC059234 TaxID=3346781 RepID=UPI0036724463
MPDLRVGGAERHVATLLPRMDPTRFEPSTICIGDEGALFPTLTEAGVDAKALHCTKRQAVRALWILVREMRRARTDVVVVRGYSAETLGRLAARIAGVRHTIMWVHNAGDTAPRGRVRILTDRVLTRWTGAYFGVANAQLPYLIDDLGYPAEKVRVIHNGVDPAKFTTATDRSVLSEFGFGVGDPVAAILAALRLEKDHATLLRSARQVIDEIPNAKFLIIGDGPTRPELERLSTALGVAANVCFAGVREDVSRLLCAIDVFVLSSSTVECFPMALLEAMACARPAVCTAVGGVSEMLEDGRTGYLVPAQDPHLLAERLSAVLSDPVSARRMGRAGRERVESEFSLDRSVAEAERAIEELVAGLSVG